MLPLFTVYMPLPMPIFICLISAAHAHAVRDAAESHVPCRATMLLMMLPPFRRQSVLCRASMLTPRHASPCLMFAVPRYALRYADYVTLPPVLTRCAQPAPARAILPRRASPLSVTPAAQDTDTKMIRYRHVLLVAAARTTAR